MTVPYVFIVSNTGPTANDIITRAARRVSILAASEVFDAADATDALQLLNDMMFGFGPRGIHYAHVKLAAADTVNIPDEQVRNLVLLFAQELALDFGRTIDPGLMNEINRAEQQLQAAYYSVPPVKPTRSLLPNRMGFFDITRGS